MALDMVGHRLRLLITYRLRRFVIFDKYIYRSEYVNVYIVYVILSYSILILIIILNILFYNYICALQVVSILDVLQRVVTQIE